MENSHFLESATKKIVQSVFDDLNSLAAFASAYYVLHTKHSDDLEVDLGMYHCLHPNVRSENVFACEDFLPMASCML